MGVAPMRTGGYNLPPSAQVCLGVGRGSHHFNVEHRHYALTFVVRISHPASQVVIPDGLKTYA